MLVILLLALTALTGCKSTEPAVSNSQVLKDMIPELPELPQWPELRWEYRDGYYCLDEADVDKVLNYWENRIPLYQSEIELFKRKLSIVMDRL